MREKVEGRKRKSKNPKICRSDFGCPEKCRSVWICFEVA